MKWKTEGFSLAGALIAPEEADSVHHLFFGATYTSKEQLTELEPLLATTGHYTNLLSYNEYTFPESGTALSFAHFIFFIASIIGFFLMLVHLLIMLRTTKKPAMILFQMGIPSKEAKQTVTNYGFALLLSAEGTGRACVYFCYLY